MNTQACDSFHRRVCVQRKCSNESCACLLLPRVGSCNFANAPLWSGRAPLCATRLTLSRRLPEPRTRLLQQELALLHRSAERLFAEPEDRALAEVSDYQGVGGKQERTSR